MRNKWFWASLILNVVLIGTSAIVWEIAGKNARPANTNSSAGQPRLATAVPLKKVSAMVSTNALTPQGQMQKWIEQFRAAGAPDKLLAEMIVADSEDRWREKDRELQKQYEKGDLDDTALTEAAEQHDADQENELRTLLGDEPFRKFDREKVLADLDLAKLNLSESDLDTMYQLRKDKAQVDRDLQRQQRSGEIDDADLDTKQAAAEAKCDEQMKALLGDRYALLTPSGDTAIAGELKRTLKGMSVNVTDDQLAALTQAQQQWNQQSENLNPEDKDYDKQQQAVEAGRDAALEKILGADGLAQFKKEQDGTYQVLKKFSAAWQLNDKEVDYVYQTVHAYQTSIRDYEQKAHALESQGQAVDWDGVQANIQQYAKQTQTALQNYLGSDRFGKIERNEFFFGVNQD